MKMIRHQAIRMDLPTRLGARLPERFQKALPIRVIFENGFAAVAAIHDVVNRAWILDSELAGHGDGLPKRGEGVNN